MEILFEDYYLLAVNKPANLSAENGSSNHPSAELEAVAYLAAELKKKSTSERPKPTPFLRAAHRLDRSVSGVLLFAKTKTALTELMGQFERHETEKTYIAICANVPAAETATLVHWLKKDESGKKALLFDGPKKGRLPCELSYKVLETNWKGATIEVHPRTGRFHQIRAQLAQIGCPVFGDELYGSRPWKEHQIKLHARNLKFKHPKSGELMEIEAPLPGHW